MLTIRPVVAQSVVTHSDEVKEHSTDEVRLAALEPDRTQVSDRWELVTDADDPAADLTGFPDYRLFQIDRMSGVLTFKTPPNYENPRSAAAATATNLAAMNVYKVKAKFGDGEKYLAVEVTVQVTGIEEDGNITLSNRRPEVGVTLMALLADPDKGIRTPDWQWQVETSEGTGVFEDIANAVNRRYTPKAEDVGKHLKATANYQDGHDTDYVEEYAESEFVVRAAPGANVAPMFREEDEDTPTDGMQTSRRIEENAAPGTMVGPALFATDNDHLPAGNPGGEPRDELTYSLLDPAGTTGTNVDGVDDDSDPNTPSDRDGHAARFSIDQATGQITTRAHLDRESLDRDGTDNDYTYTVVVKATDPSGKEGEATLTIHVLDVEETPQLTGPAALTYFENSANSTNDPELRLDRIPSSTATDATETADVQEALYRATDNDLDDDAAVAVGDIQWELTGPDAARFQFESSTVTYTDSETLTNDEGTPIATRDPAVATAPALQFRSAPNVEAPADVGGTRGDNIYEITVRAWDEDWLIGSRDVTIRVADTDDLGTITLSHIRPQQGIELAATLNDPDGVSGQVKWQWYPGDDTSGTPIDGATSATFTPPTTGAGSSDELTVLATYEDRGSRGQERMAMTTTANAVRDNPVAVDDPDTTDVDESGENKDPTFYVDYYLDETQTPPERTVLDPGEEARRISANETSSYVRYVLEGQHPINVRNSELAAREYVDSSGGAEDTAATVKVWDGHIATAADLAATPPRVTADGTNGRENLQFDLSGADAKYFAINQNPGETGDPAGLIKTKGPLDFETKSTYTVTVTATDPTGAKDTATVTIKVLDQAEIEGVPGDEKRVWVDENTYFIDSLKANNPPDVSLGGLKWSLLTADEPANTPANNRNDVRSVDCQFDDMNDNLCDDFRFSQFNTANTNLLFAIGKGETHDAPDFEDPKDVLGITGETSDPDEQTFDASGQEAGNNVYQVRVRVAFATLRSDGDANHPNPASDEMEERTYVMRVVDVDEAPTFRGDDSDQSIDENSDDDLPRIDINRDVGGSVTAMDPEDTSTPDPNKKLTFTLSLPQAYSNMFDIVPSTGEIVTRSRIDYEALDLEEQGTPGGQYKAITGVTVTVNDSSGMADNMATLPVSINVRDVNETPVAAQPLVISGDAAVSDYAENQDDTTVGTYMVSGDNEDTATWSRSGADMALFDLDVDGQEATLKFMDAPDFEMPADADGDNMYMVTIQVMYDADDMDSRDVTVTVTNVEEMGTVTLAPTRPSVGTAIVASLEDMDMVMEGTVMWQWASADAMDGDFTNITGATMYTYTPVAADASMWLRAMATYTDGFDSGNVAMMVTETAVTEVPVNVAPEFADETATRSIPENTAANTNIGDPFEATDDNGDTLTYSLEGTDAASFRINESTGQLRTSAALNFETKSTYSVVVKATDPGELSDTIDVTINVTDVDEEVPMTVQDYDTNGTAGIQIDEVFDAINDYFDDGLSIAELFEVIDAYFNG